TARHRSTRYLPMSRLSRKQRTNSKRPAAWKQGLSTCAFIDDFVRGRGLRPRALCFPEFFASELGVDIDDPIYAEHGGSKGSNIEQSHHFPVAGRRLGSIMRSAGPKLPPFSLRSFLA